MSGAVDKLTNKQRRLLRYLYTYRLTSGQRPRLADIITDLELGSNSSVLTMLRALLVKGYVGPASKLAHSTIVTEKAITELNLGAPAAKYSQLLQDQFVSIYSYPSTGNIGIQTFEPGLPTFYSDHSSAGTEIDPDLDERQPSLFAIVNAFTGTFAHSTPKQRISPRALQKHVWLGAPLYLAVEALLN